jgi:alginate O-acetyltransferase complex protein AlgI
VWGVTPQSAAAGVDIDSWVFLVLAAVAIIGCRALRRPLPRGLLLLTLNVAFVASFIADTASWIVLAGFLGGTWLVGEARARLGGRWPAAAQVVLVTGLWLFLFAVKDPTLATAVNPFASLAVKIVGVSYLVFRAISYVMEVKLVEDRSLLGFLGYMLFFPTLLSGPIERYRRFTAVSDLSAAPGADHVLPALHRITTGLLMKFALADNLQVFALFTVGKIDGIEQSVLWLGVLLQLFVIFLDFAGYCHVVIGLAALMGYPIAENFERPFRATNIQAFWDHWHMTLTSMVKDYVFTPIVKLVFSRVPRRAQARAVIGVYFFSMVLIALWHGTTAGFLLFGVLHGLALVAFQLKKARRKQLERIVWLKRPAVRATLTLGSAAATYVFVSLSLVPWVGEYEVWGSLFHLLFLGN